MASETIAHIVAEMRGLAADIEAGNAIVGQTVWRNYADRIEAAAKRERVEVEADALSAGGLVEAMRHKPSNAAAMREALANLVDVIDRCDSGSPLWWHCGAKGVKPLKDAKAALAAPPRNCDRPECQTTPEAARVWKLEDGGKTAYHEWLLAPAKECEKKEGGAK